MKQKINKEITNEYNLGASVHIQMQRDGSRVHLDVSALYHCIHIDSRHGGCRPNRQTISKRKSQNPIFSYFYPDFICMGQWDDSDPILPDDLVK